MKKIISILGVAICAMVLFFNVSINGKNNANDTDLTKVMMSNEANAECVWNPGGDIWNHGYCSEFGWCNWDPEGTACDPWVR